MKIFFVLINLGDECHHRYVKAETKGAALAKIDKKFNLDKLIHLQITEAADQNEQAYSSFSEVIE